MAWYWELLYWMIAMCFAWERLMIMAAAIGGLKAVSRYPNNYLWHLLTLMGVVMIAARFFFKF